jgi:uncharacterized membrane protein
VWIAHNYMTRFVKATDRGLIRLNLLLLLFVSFLPFTTAIAAQRLEAARPPGSQNASSDKGKIAAIWTAHGALDHPAPVSWR